MSSIIGFVGKCDEEILGKINSVAGNPLINIKQPNLLIRACGYEKTCFGGNKFIAVGTGINYSDNETRFLNNSDWEETNESNINSLNGHFIFIKWDEHKINFYTDRIGLRDLYFYKPDSNCVIFSSRSDWLAKTFNLKINFEEFGGRWLLFNQLSSASIFKNLQRYNRGAKIYINRHTLEFAENKSNSLMDFNRGNFSERNFSETLMNLVSFPIKNNAAASLGLSGGMDSRVLLSYLMNEPRNNWTSHTFGQINNPDVEIAIDIAGKLNFENRLINLKIDDRENFINEFRKYTAQSLVNNSLSSFAHLENQRAFYGTNTIIVDGGFGEIWRREFFSKLLFRGKKFLLDKNTKNILPFLEITRANIFNGDIKKIMNGGCQVQLQNLFDELPDIGKIGIENWIDLFAIKTRIPNYYSNEQSRTDNYFINYMPFLQPALLQNLSSIDISLRRNGVLFKKIISSNFKDLEKFPLAKGNFKLPYGYGTITNRILSLILKNISHGKSLSNFQNYLLNNFLYDFILDLLNSREVKECGLYDNEKINRLSYNFKTKSLDAGGLNELDWWLSFELFRQETKKNLSHT